MTFENNSKLIRKDCPRIQMWQFVKMNVVMKKWVPFISLKYGVFQTKSRVLVSRFLADGRGDS